MEAPNRRIGAYLRVSTLDQSTDLQKQELAAYIRARGWAQVTWYEDKASGTKSNRIELQKLLTDARSRKIDLIIVWKLDRWGRSLKDVLCMLQELAELNVEFCSLKDQIDLSTSTGRLLMHLLGAFAEFEASMIRMRVRAGLQAAKKKGRRLGRPCRIDAQRVFFLRQQGFSLGQIGRQVGATKSAVSKILSKAEFPKVLNNSDFAEVVERPLRR